MKIVVVLKSISTLNAVIELLLEMKKRHLDIVLDIEVKVG